MRLRHIALAAGMVGVSCLPAHADARDISRDTLPANDGWASEGEGTTGGSAADAAQVYTVTDRAGLVRALDGGSATPKIIRIAGTVDANTDDDGDHLDCADYATDGYGLKKYLAAYDPRTWGAAKPSGPQEEARQASAKKQAERVELLVGSNTTIVRLKGAVLKGGSLQVRNATNIIIRNLDLRDAYDCFPVWQPNTGGLGDWKTAYDTIWLTGSTHVWVDHVTLSDKGHPDADEPTYFARNAPNGHGSPVSVGSSDHRVGGPTAGRAESDACGGSCKTDLPGDRQGPAKQEPVVVPLGGTGLNLQPSGRGGRQSLGISTEGAFYAEGLVCVKPSSVEVADLVKSWNGSALHQTGTLFNGYPVDLLAIHNAYNSGSERDLTADVGWTPTLHTKIDSAEAADQQVARGAGAGRIP
ncbi:pectate lyase [Streptomyces canus]|uniref:pectate lyase family protein n=1 Tax=Streptomyces canus TaxID=58343 RepID=UPI00386815D3|nr:pectate lyase [Streptomyces canus]